MHTPEEEKKEGAVPSPEEFLPDANTVEFDYNKHQDETTVKATVEILKCMGRNAELLANKHDVSNEVIVDNMSKVAQEMMNIIIDCKVPNIDMQKLSDMMSQLPFQLFSIIGRQKTEFEKELLARYIGVRDPGTKKYSREFASMGDMFQALLRLRKDQGDNIEDYYNLTKPKKE